MKKNRVWIVEITAKGEKNWKPIGPDMFFCRSKARQAAKQCEEVLGDLHDYCVRCYEARDDT